MQVDVLIVGAGPAGLMAAAWMARTGIRTLVIERKPGQTKFGHADGLESRTLEILDSFGLGQRIWDESNHTIDTCLWSQHPDGSLQRQSIAANSLPGWSRYHESTLGQPRIENHLLELALQSPHMEVRKETVPTSLDIDESALEDHRPDSYPIRVKLAPAPGSDAFNARTGERTPKTTGNMVEAKYMLGSDGAHSWVRSQLGLELEGISRQDANWGVLDALPLTDFPDIRRRCVIKSDSGNLMYIPRERKLVRIYVQVSVEVANEYKAKGRDPGVIVKAVQKVMRPYRFDVSTLEWSTIYSVRHKYCRELSRYDRIFLAGDAIHSHSPKAGQGMNVSIQDAYNLGWKLASVIRGVCHPHILRTYHEERFPVAKRLIDLDKRLCDGMLQAENTYDDDYKAALVAENTSLSGLGVTYEPNMLVAKTPRLGDFRLPQQPNQLRYIKLGARIPSDVVLGQSDSQPHQLQRIFPSTGEWNLIVFGGNIVDEVQRRRIETLAAALSSPSSTAKKMSSRRQSNGHVVGSLLVYLVHSARRTEVDLWQLPEIFRPHDNNTGIHYGRVFADNESHQGGGSAYQGYGISSQGCLVLLRPDQHVSLICGLEDTNLLECFLNTLNTGNTVITPALFPSRL